MVFVFGKDSDGCQDVVRSQDPDVTISVGSGESKQEFKCYKVILSFASSYLDAMLSSSMKEGEMSKIDFPDKDPEEWKLFYDFISPQKIGEANHIAEINNNNVMTLLPWFHEFGIDAYVNECDVFLSQRYLSKDEKTFWDKSKIIPMTNVEPSIMESMREAQQKSKFDAIIGVLNTSKLYDLTLSKVEMEGRVVELLNMLPQTYALFDIASVKSLLQGLPFELDDETGLAVGDDSGLGPVCKEILSPFVSTLSQDIIDNQDRFCELFYCYMRVKVEKDKLQAAVGIIRTFIHDVPDELYNKLSQSYNAEPRGTLKKIVSNHYKNNHKKDFQDLGITLPDGY